LAWLRFEVGSEVLDKGEVRLTTLPDGEDRLIAYCGYHGRPVEWLA
jgi:hypothetical protein